MDGTLLNQYWRVSEQNQQAILKAQAQGIEFVVATGRPYTNVNVILDEVGISCPVISLNGAETRDSNGNLIASMPLSKEQVQAVHNILQEEDVYFELMTTQGSYSLSKQRCIDISREYARHEHPDMPQEQFEKVLLEMTEERIRNERCQFVDSFEPIMADDTIVVLKIFALSSDKEQLARATKRVQSLSGLAITNSGYNNLEVNHEHGHKGYAVLEYAKSKGIDPEHIMTMGDSYNDLTMLKLAGRGVAMANAPEELRAQVKHVTKTNLESGVAHAIHEMLGTLQVK